MPRLFLLDGMALVYRAHFAFIQNPIRNSKGTNTSAIYGFTNTLLSILESGQATHLGVAFDTSAPTARHIKFPAYKAQRDAMPEELAAAIPHVKRICNAFQIPVLELDGYEADDLIGTLAKHAETEGFDTFMVTPDKDFAQLVSPHISIWRPGRKGADHEILDVPAILRDWEIERPLQVIDILGLWGDAADNIPGVPGIGEKTAKQLIARFGSIENLIARSGELKGKQKENVQTFADQALLSKDLATIILDAPIHATWDDLVVSPHDDQAILDLFREFEFRTLAKRITDGKPDTTSPSPDKDLSAPPPARDSASPLRDIHAVTHIYHLADTPEKRTELFTALRGQASFCFDIETTGLDRFQAKLLGIAFSWAAHEAWYLPVRSDDTDLVARIREILSGPAEKIGHNLKYDLSVLHNHGIRPAGPFFDTMLADMLVAPDRRHTMDYLAEILLHYKTVKLADIASPRAPGGEAPSDDLFAYAAAPKKSKDLDISAIPPAALAEYAAEDADITFQLAASLRPLLEASGQFPIFHTIEAPLLPILVDMEMEGIAVDLSALGSISRSLGEQIDILAASIHAHAGGTFNLNSPKQLGEILFDRLNLGEKAKKTKTGQYKTDEQTLSTLAGKHPIIDDILAWREASKLRSTYVDALPTHIVPQTGRLHTHFHQLVAATGRLASSDPNLQNIPVRSQAGKEIRRAFVPRQSPSARFTLLSCDYSQIELRVMAALSGDTSMIGAFRSHHDIHTATAAKVFHIPEDDVTPDMRRTAKMVNFGIIYGISAFGLSQRLAIPRQEAASIIDSYFIQYPAIRAFMDNTIATARENGWVETLSGRRRLLPDLLSANQNIRGNAERAAINTPIQGTAADMIKLAMIRVDSLLREKPYQTRMLLQVHDELVFDLHVSEQDDLIPRILHAMSHALPLPHDVPVSVEAGTGANWLAAH
jgi:DNA polymerase-1